ncbi:MAG: SARP family transcriptional regulator, partial [Aliifodinibius sp.]|nr:SARP family transcriptional regulator [Fodinibius sp.]NIV16043.1 SARP family transcriptional regulator [Fodinibius sp.]NIY29997.1 SARP family transcriptional regulator [Fodinibius sp.]
MNSLEIKLLGTFQAAIGTRPLTQFRSDKVRALLIYLVVEAERPHRRETLAGLLWPDFSQKSALSNLRKSIYHLRQALDKVEPGFSDQLLIITRQTIQIIPEKLLVDFNQFQEHLDFIKQHHHQHLHNCDHCLEALKNAASLYQGDFTTGFSLADASTFESWLLIQRESAQQEALFAMEHLAAASEVSGDYEQARYYASKQLMLEPWRENAYRQLMRALALNGRRAEALAQYENCRQILWDELEVEPAPETQQLFEAIKNDKLVPQESRTQTQLHHFPTPFTPFIG